METLPVEILIEIFRYLNVREVLAVSEVCTTFEAVVNSITFMDKIWARLVNFESFRRSTRNYSKLKIVKAKGDQLEKCNRMLSESRANFITSANQLKLDNVEIPCHQVFGDFIEKFKNTKVIHLEGLHLKTSSSTLNRLLLPNLRVLKFFYSTNDLLQHFIETKNLKTLKLCLIPHEHEQDKIKNFRMVLQILENNRDSIEKLNFYDVNFDDHFLEQISTIKFHELKRFSMSFNAYLSPESCGFENFIKRNAASLEKFKIRTFDHIKQHHLKILIRNAVNLQNLNLIVCSYCDYGSFEDFKNLKKLVKLKIQPTSFCVGGNFCYKKFIEDKVLRHRNESMKVIEIRMLPLTEDIVIKISSSFPNLTELKLTSISEVQPCLVQLMSDKMKHLKKLVLNNAVIPL